MTRPKGVTAIGNIFLVFAFGSLIGAVPQMTQLKSREWLELLLNVITLIILGSALLKMQSWSRWASIAVSVIALAFIPRFVSLSSKPEHLVHAGIRVLLYVWVIWYLSRPHVKAAFERPV